MKGKLNAHISDIISDYSSGMSASLIAKKYGCNSEAIRYQLIKSGIKRRGESTYRKNNLDENFFSVIDTEEKAWLLGFIAADGSLREYNRGFYLSIELAKEDESILNRITEILKSDYPFYYSPNRNAVRLSVSSKKLVTDLISKGITQNKTNSIEYPSEIPTSLDRHFIRGVFDGDGWLCRTKQDNFHLGFCGNRALLATIMEKLVSQTSVNPVKLVQGSATTRENIVQMTFSSNKSIALIVDYLYRGSVVYLPRKKVISDVFVSTKSEQIKRSFSRGDSDAYLGYQSKTSLS